MMTRTPLQATEDILLTINDIQTILGKKDLTKAFSSITTRRAIERCLQIIAEAVRHLPPSQTKRHPDIDWQSIRDTGNFLRHEYADVSPPILMNVVRDHLKPLKKACEQIRDQLVDA